MLQLSRAVKHLPGFSPMWGAQVYLVSLILYGQGDSRAKNLYRQGESTGWNNSQTDVRSLRRFFFCGKPPSGLNMFVLNTIDRSSNTWTIESNRFTCCYCQWQMWCLRMPGFTCPFTSVLWLQDILAAFIQSPSQTYLQRIMRIRRIW